MKWKIMGQNGSNQDRVHTVSIGSMGKQKIRWKMEKIGKNGKMCDGKLEKSKSRAFATQANKPKVSFEQSKSFKIKKWEIF